MAHWLVNALTKRVKEKKQTEKVNGMKSIIRETQTSLLAGLIVGSMVCTAAVSFAAEGQWIRKADMPTPRFGSSIAEVDGKLFVIGGSQSNGRLATVEVYDPSTDSWTPRAAMPTARKNTAAAVVNGIIYAFGGTPSIECACITTTEAYDPKDPLANLEAADALDRYARGPQNDAKPEPGGCAVAGRLSEDTKTSVAVLVLGIQVPFGRGRDKARGDGLR